MNMGNDLEYLKSLFPDVEVNELYCSFRKSIWITIINGIQSKEICDILIHTVCDHLHFLLTDNLSKENEIYDKAKKTVGITEPNFGTVCFDLVSALITVKDSFLILYLLLERYEYLRSLDSIKIVNKVRKD